MAVFKCKMCGGALEIAEGAKVATCEYCGTKQTLPKLDDDRRANMYDRANQMRRNNEFDKAMGIYEQILSEDPSDAEAYWSLVLCRYGIEYVEDPASHKRIPTVNRAQLTPIFSDENYKSALERADVLQREVFEAEARVIDELQKGILAISQKEEPFDVFICYKESDGLGNRTVDSVLATELYRELEREGIRTFFSRITLEDKLGSAYEPYIFAALHSARVMVAVGTKPEYFNAPWVKNEWSRYLALIDGGARKTIIPAYKDMDPYDLPEQFAPLQAQDLAKIGAMQDLVRGIKKIVASDDPKPAPVVETIPAGNANVAPLLKRAFMFLEDGDWTAANEYCEKVLDIDPECAEAYLGKLMACLQVRVPDALKDHPVPFDGNNNYQKALRFADETLKTALTGYIEHINTRNENARLEGIYTLAKKTMSLANTESAYKEAAHLFESISEYLDASSLAQECFERAESARKDAILADGKAKMLRVNISIASYESAIKLFESISGWKDADEQACACRRKIDEIKEQQEAARLKRARQAEIARAKAQKRARRIKRIAIIATLIVFAIIVFIIVLNTVIIPNVKYNKAVGLMESGEVEEAYEIFLVLGDYKDAAECAGEIRLDKTIEQLKNVNVGDTVQFGAYEQDNDKSNGKEEIEWQVLEIVDGKALLICKYALDAVPYNEKHKDVTWESCTLRAWLNDEFIEAAFSEKEQDLIPSVTVSADKNPEYSTNPGKATQDQIFLLSIPEVNKYFRSDGARQCKPTDYAVTNGAYVNSDNDNCWWWLRSPGEFQDDAAFVNRDGCVYEYGDDVDYSHNAVRPALWVDLDG